MARSVWLALTCATMASPAVAASGDQAVVDRAYAPWTAASFRAAYDVAKCVAERYPALADAYVRNTENGNLFADERARLIDTKCIKAKMFKSVTVAISSNTYPMVLAQALIVRELSRGRMLAVTDVVGANDRPTLANIAVADIHPYYRDTYALDRLQRSLGEQSECIARAAPEKVVSLAAIEFGSPAERTILEELDRAAGSCSAKPTTVVFPEVARRGVLMVELYRLMARAPERDARGAN